MSALKAARASQYPLFAEFTFNFNDTATDTVGGTSKTFGSTYTDALVFDAIPLPPNAVVVGGDITVETAYTGTTASTLSVGDATLATRHATTVDLKTAARTALTLTGFRGTGENLRLTFAHTVANATAGKVTVRVEYIIQNRTSENQIS